MGELRQMFGQALRRRRRAGARADRVTKIATAVDGAIHPPDHKEDQAGPPHPPADPPEPVDHLTHTPVDAVLAVLKVSAYLIEAKWRWLPRIQRERRGRLLVLAGLLTVAGWFAPWYVTVYQVQSPTELARVAGGQGIAIGTQKVDYFLQFQDRFYLGAYSGSDVAGQPAVAALTGAGRHILYAGFALILLGLLIQRFDPEDHRPVRRFLGNAVRGLPALLLVWPMWLVVRHAPAVLDGRTVTDSLRHTFLSTRGAPDLRNVSTHLSIGFVALGLALLIATVSATCGQRLERTAPKSAADEGELRATMAVFTTAARLLLIGLAGYLAAYVALHHTQLW